MPDKLQKHTLNLRPGDYQRIVEVFEHRQIKAAVVIRHIVSKFVDSLAVENTEEELLALKGVDE